MAKETIYRQCQLECPTSTGGKKQLVTWIPEKHGGVMIEAGLRITLRDPRTKGDLDGIWTVVSVGSMPREGSWVFEKQISWKQHRKATDV